MRSARQVPNPWRSVLQLCDPARLPVPFGAVLAGPPGSSREVATDNATPRVKKQLVAPSCNPRTTIRGLTGLVYCAPATADKVSLVILYAVPGALIARSGPGDRSGGRQDKGDARPGMIRPGIRHSDGHQMLRVGPRVNGYAVLRCATAPPGAPGRDPTQLASYRAWRPAVGDGGRACRAALGPGGPRAPTLVRPAGRSTRRSSRDPE